MKFSSIKRNNDDPVIDINGTRSLQSIYNDVLSGKVDSSVLADRYQLDERDSDNIPAKDENMNVPLERMPGTDINIAFEHSVSAKQDLADKVNSAVKTNQYNAYKHQNDL